MSTLPKVEVHIKKNPVKSKPGLASRIALIGAFEELLSYC